MDIVAGSPGPHTDGMLDVTAAPNSPSCEARIRFHQPHLERVSRSFAYGISRLEPTLRASVGLGYLICRILDTVEDAAWPSRERQLQAFEQFDQFVTSTLVDHDAVQRWVARFPETVSKGERCLLEDATQVFSEFSTLPERERSAMLSPILSMSRGMAAYVERGLSLRSLVDVNVYCFFVAGVVGELLTGLIEDDLRPNGLKLPLDLATHFGLFLQKINVLKDQVTDEAEGRFLIPDRAQVFDSLYANANGAFAYLRALPIARRDYRLFCAWSLFLGLATVPVLREGGSKLSRIDAMALGARIELAISDTERLENLFSELVTRAWPSPVRAPLGSVHEARLLLGSLYSGRLDLEQLCEILAGKH